MLSQSSAVLCQKLYLICLHRPLFLPWIYAITSGTHVKAKYQNILRALWFNCNLHKTEPPFACFATSGKCIWCPQVLTGCEKVNDPCLVGTCPPAPLRLHHLHDGLLSQLWGPTLSTWTQELHPFGTAAWWSHRIPQVNCKTALVAHPKRRSWVICPCPCPWTPRPGPLPPPLPPRCAPTFRLLFISIIGKLGKSLRNLERKCGVLAVKEYLQNIYRLFKQLASTLGNNLSTGCLPALLGGRKI